MTKFLQYKGKDDWWEWPEGSMTIYNIKGGHHYINENSEAFMEGTVMRAADWSDLCRKTGYNPWRTETPTPYMWIDPEGVMYKCEGWGAHEITADYILNYILGEEVSIFDCGDRLIELGWIKVSTNRILQESYIENDMYINITSKQNHTLSEWAKEFDMYYW